jgi:hypothetical protein
MSQDPVSEKFAYENGLHSLFSDSDLERASKLDQVVISDDKKAYPAGWFTQEPYPIEWLDLSRLYALIRTRHVISAMEFGCGYSTVVMAYGLACNEQDDGMYVRDSLRRTNPYQLNVVDDMESYIDLTTGRLSSDLRDRVTFQYSPVRMTTFGGRICTEYETMPNTCPDLIYLDGPDQHHVQGDINGVSTRALDRMPMSCDILKIEHFLLPGTLIVTDGRTANARFLAANFQREWRHEHDEEGDVHYFELIEEPIGKWNRRQIEFCLGTDWRAKPLRPDLSKVPS